MKCFFCKRTVERGFFTFVKARNHRERDNYRELCEACSEAYLTGRGYVVTMVVNGVKVYGRPNQKRVVGR